MKQHAVWRDTWRTIAKSQGRFWSLLLLLMVASFALTGLKITGSDMRATARNFYQKTNLADLTVNSNYSFDKNDRTLIKRLQGIAKVEWGYFQDTTINHSDQPIRIYSLTKDISKNQIVSGRLPKRKDEIALSYLLEDKYHLGQTLKLNQHNLLAVKRVKIVGFIRSSEHTNRLEIGATNVGDGQLAGVAVMPNKSFSSKYYLIGRIKLKQSQGLDPYSERYSDLVDTKQKELTNLLDKRANRKQQKLEAQIAKGEIKLKEAQRQLKQQEFFAQFDPQIKKHLQVAKERLMQQATVLKTSKLQAKKLGKPQFTVNDRNQDSGYTTYHSNSQKIDLIATVFPAFLFAIAALVSWNAMTRFVEEERLNIGAMKAIGYSNFAISKKFVFYGLATTVPGVTLGTLIGSYYLPQKIFTAYAINSTMTGFITKFPWDAFMIALVIALICTCGAAIIQLRVTFRSKPAALLLPKPPTHGSRILLERITPLWKRLSFNRKVTLRNLFRYKSRMLMTIFGVAGCTGLLVMGFGINDSLKGISQRQFANIVNYDLLTVNQNHPSKDAKNKLNDLLKSSQVKRTSKIRFETLSKKVKSDPAKQQISLLVAEPQTLKKYFRLYNDRSHQALALSNQGVIISEKLAKLLQAKTGSWISLQKDGKSYRMKVAGIAEMYLGHYLFMTPQQYRQIFKTEFQVNSRLVSLKQHQSKYVHQFATKVLATDAIKGVNISSDNKSMIDNMITSLNQVMILLIIIAGSLAVVVLYNLTNTNVEERMRELSTLKVLGFFDKEVTLYIYRETIILSIIGIVVGYGWGKWLHFYIIDNLPPTNAMFDPNTYWSNYLLSALIPLVITLILAVIVYRKIKTVDMLDALQSVE